MEERRVPERVVAECDCGNVVSAAGGTLEPAELLLDGAVVVDGCERVSVDKLLDVSKAAVLAMLVEEEADPPADTPTDRGLAVLVPT